jgi:alkanesulfonate monooxygenase SsuD/methylene tetrahydromethanopterin reductase-like flavin-dependent oxidoreductase (luciferase family)
MLAFHMFCHEDRAAAHAVARAPLERYLRSLVEAASDWTGGLSSADYPGYDRIIETLRKETFESQIASGSAWIGTPGEIAAQIEAFIARVGPFESASLQVNFNTIGIEDAIPSVRLFSDAVMPHFRDR